MDLRNYLSQIELKKTGYLKLKTIKTAGLLNYPFVVMSLPKKINPDNLKTHIWSMDISGHASYTNLQFTDLQFIKFINQIIEMNIGDTIKFTDIFEEPHNKSVGFKVIIDNQKSVSTIDIKESSNEHTTYSDSNRDENLPRAIIKEEPEGTPVEDEPKLNKLPEVTRREDIGTDRRINNTNKGTGMSKTLKTWGAVMREYPNEILSSSEDDLFITNEIANHVDNEQMTSCFHNWRKFHRDLTKYCLPRVRKAEKRKEFILNLISLLEKNHPEILEVATKEVAAQTAETETLDFSKDTI